MELKFRAWHKATELMDEVVTIDLYDEKIGVLYANPITQGEDIQRFDFDEIELMQYTGLKDKNGVEIYEYNELDGAYEVIFKDLKYSLRHISNNDIIGLQDYWRDKNGEIEVTREYTKV